MFKTKPNFYKVVCKGSQEECLKDPTKLAMVSIDADEAKREGKILAVNGIFNDAQRAGELAYQNTPVDEEKRKPSELTLMYIPRSDTVLGELMVGSYEKDLASILGYTIADHTYADTVQGRGQQEISIDRP